MIQLTEREKLILQSIVQTFTEKTTPVGSRYIARKHRMNISPATIRNVMADLEEKGLIWQPHTSAGRVPTDKGYRYYVDSLMTREKLTSLEKKAIRRNLANLSPDVEDILERSSQVLGKISSLLGVVLSPRFYQGMLEKLELVSISEKRLMLVMTIKSGLVKTIIIEIKSQISHEKLEETARLLNQRLSGLTLKEIKDSIDRRMRDVSEGDATLIQLLIKSADRVFSFDERKRFHCCGTPNIMAQPEFSDHEKFRRMLELIENPQVIIQVLNEEEARGKIAITIGEENREELMKNCSVVTAGYNFGNATGTLGVIGPTRMRYAKMVTLVDFMAETLGHLIGRA